ncbi:MAG: hypothetical protein ACP5MV_04540 [Candidatus Parvarchaeum sp.]
MAYEDKSEYPFKIKLKREERGLNLIDYLEKAASDLDLYTEKSYLTGRMCGDLYMRKGECVNLSFFRPVSKLLHLYVGQFSILIDTNKKYQYLVVRDEPLASLKRVKAISGKLESKMEELLQ